MLNISSKETSYPLKVGVTGGIGSGKSVVCRIFGTLGIPVFEADKVARLLIETDANLRQKLSSLLGDAIFTVPGQVDRKKMAALIFGDEQLLEQVNSMVHPAVRAEFSSWHRLQKSVYVIQEAAILFESGAYRQMDITIHVSADEALRTDRVVKRDHISAEQVRKRMNHQWTDVRKSGLADYEIVNDGKHFLTSQVIEIHNKILNYGKIC
jgi:dephospho-CoA kinase